MTKIRPDYTKARNYYIKGEGNEYPTLQDIATEFNFKFLIAKIDLIDHCLIELKKNEKKTKMPEEYF